MPSTDTSPRPPSSRPPGRHVTGGAKLPAVPRLNYRDPVAVAKAFTAAYYSYDYRHPAALDPVVRVRAYTTPRYLEGLRTLSGVFPRRMTEIKEQARTALRYAAIEPEAPNSPSAAYVTVTYTQDVTDAGRPVTRPGTWNLRLVRMQGAWRVDGVAQQ